MPALIPTIISIADDTDTPIRNEKTTRIMVVRGSCNPEYPEVPKTCIIQNSHADDVANGINEKNVRINVSNGSLIRRSMKKHTTNQTAAYIRKAVGPGGKYGLKCMY